MCSLNVYVCYAATDPRNCATGLQRELAAVIQAVRSNPAGMGGSCCGLILNLGVRKYALLCLEIRCHIARAELPFGTSLKMFLRAKACVLRSESAALACSTRLDAVGVIRMVSTTACCWANWVPRAAQSAGAIAALAAQRGADSGYESPYSREALRQGLDLAWWQKLAGASVRDGRLELGALRVRSWGLLAGSSALDLAWWQKLAGASVRDGRLVRGALRVRSRGF